MAKTLSTAPLTKYDAAAFKKLQPRPVASLRDVAGVISALVWSPCVWKNGVRKKENFLYSDFLSLDFDDGKFTLADAIEYAKDLELHAIIGTTKSHQIEKNGKPAVDRFRLVVPWQKRITDREQYEQNTDRMVRSLGADPAAKDAGRFFWPCTKIVLVNCGKIGIYVSAVEKKTTYSVHPSLIDSRESGAIPKWLKNHLHSFHEGSRNKKAFWFACRLKEIGFDQVQALRYLSPYANLTEKELKRTIEQAFKY